MALAPRLFTERLHQARFADARLTTQQDDLSQPCLALLPAPQQ